MGVDVLQTLAKVLFGVGDLSWDYALYIPASNPSWLPDMPVMVLDPEESDDPDDDPDEAKKNNLKYALTISSVQDVVDNARAQDANADLNILIKALKYYYDNDAFIDMN
jgi:hypothetical protein